MLGILPNPYVILAIVAAFISVAIGGFAEGYHYKSLADDSAAAAAEEAVIVQTDTANLITFQAVAQATLELQKIAEFTQTQIMEVPVYVTPKADAACIVPAGFVRLHDAAAAGLPVVPAGPGQSDDRPAGVALSAVAGAVAGNYGRCRAIRQQLIDLQDWIAAQQASLARFEPALP